MGALTAARNTKESGARVANFLRDKVVKTPGSLFVGASGAIDADNKAVPASDTAGLIVLGRVERIYTGGDGLEHALIKSGLFAFNNGSAAEALDSSDIGSLVYVVDDQTFGAVGGTNHVKGGVLRDIDADGLLWFEIGNIRLT